MMQLKEFDIILDIKTKEVKYRDPVSGQKLDEIEVIKGDYKSTRLNIFLESGKQPYIIGDSTVEVVFEKYDRTVVVMDKTSEGFIVEENVIKTTLSTNITAIAGRQVKGEVVVKGVNGEVLTSRANFYFRVHRGILTDDVIASTNELPLLNRLIDQVTELDANLTTNEQQRVVTFDGIVDTANTTKTGLDVSIQDGIKAKDDLELAIQNGGVIYEDVDMLKGLRIYKGIVEPIDTSFWYDTSDNTGITRA